MFTQTPSTEHYLLTCWSAKGGSGVTVSAALLAVCLSRHHDVVLIDAAGDQAALFGIEQVGVGFDDWVAGGPDVPVPSLTRLAVEVRPRMLLVPTRKAAMGSPDPSMIVDRLRLAFPRSIVVIDAGTITNDLDARCVLVDQADQSLAFVRPCYLAARRLSSSGRRSTGFVYVDEPARVLRAEDMRGVLGVPHVATIELDPQVARIADAGRLGSRLPRSVKAIKQLASQLVAESQARAV